MWRSLTLDQTWQATRFTFKYCIAYAWMLLCRLSSIALLIAYFPKKNYSLRQNILKILRVWEMSLTSVPIGVYLDLIGVGTWLGIGSTKDFEDLLEKEWPDAASDSKVQRPVSSQEVNLAAKEWPDFAVQCPVRRHSCIRSSEDEGDRLDRTLATSGQLWSDVSSHDSRGFRPL